MGSLINSSNILNSLTNSGMRAKKYARLSDRERFEFSGGALHLYGQRTLASLSWMM